MKQKLSKTDKQSIIKGLKAGVFVVTELNHLTKDISDFTGEAELFGTVTFPLTTVDKRQLLAALHTGWLDVEKMPDLKEKLGRNYFLDIMIASSSED